MNICKCTKQSPNAFGCCPQCGNVVMGRGLRSSFNPIDDFKPARSIDYDEIQKPINHVHASIDDEGRVTIDARVLLGEKVGTQINDAMRMLNKHFDEQAELFRVAFTVPDGQPSIDSMFADVDAFGAMLNSLDKFTSVHNIVRGFSPSPIWGWRYGYYSLLDSMGWIETDELLRARLKAATPPKQPAYIYATGEDLDKAVWPLNRSTACLPVWGWEYSAKADIGGAYWYSVHPESDAHLRKRYALALASNWSR